jgi:hypothetical protein
MGKAKCAFTKTAVRRALEGAKEAGVPVQVVIDLNAKTMTLTPISTSDVKDGTVTAKSDWDSIYAQN